MKLTKKQQATLDKRMNKNYITFVVCMCCDDLD